MEYSLGKILTDLTEASWGQVHEFEPVEESLKLALGKLVVVVSLKKEICPAGMEMAEAGKEILRRLNELYYGGELRGVLDKLKSAVVNTEGEFGGAEIGVISLVDGAIYFAATMGMKIWVTKRAGSGWVTMGRELSAGSGWEEDGETMVVGDGNFWERLTETEVERVVKGRGRGMEEMVESLVVALQSKGMGGGTGAVMRINKAVMAKEMSEEVREVAKIEYKPKTSWRQRWQKVREKIKIGTSQGGVYVVNQGNTDRSKNRKRMMIVGAACLAVWMVLVGVGQMRSREIAEKTSDDYLAVGKIVTKYEEAKAVTGLDPTRSKLLLAEVKVDIEALGEKGKKDDRILVIGAEYNKVLGEATGVIEVEVKEILDLGLVREDVNGTKLASGDEGKLWVGDTVGHRLIMVNSETGAGSVSAGKENLGEVKLIATYPGKIEVLSDKGIVQCLMTNNQCEVVVKADEEWVEVAGMKVWAGNVYLFDRGAKQIWKYTGADAGFGVRQAWLAETEASLGDKLAEGENMTIDGNIWILGKLGNELLKFTRGVGEVITLLGLDQPNGSGSVVYTDDGLENLYILDATNKRVVRTTKTGQYVKAWRNEKVGEMKDLVVDEKKGKIWLVGGKRVLEISI